MLQIFNMHTSVSSPYSVTPSISRPGSWCWSDLESDSLDTRGRAQGQRILPGHQKSSFKERVFIIKIRGCLALLSLCFSSGPV